MGLALHNFHDTNGQFPTGGSSRVDGSSYTANGQPYGPDKQTACWMFQILPFIEQDPLYNTNNVRLPDKGNKKFFSGSQLAPFGPFNPGDYRTDETNAPGGPLSHVAIKTYYCPSRRPSGLYVGNRGPTSLNDYACVVAGASPLERYPDGTVKYGPDYGFGDANSYGVIHRRLDDGNNYRQIVGRSTIATITKGTSNTMVIGEKFVFTDLYGGGWWADSTGPIGGWDADIARSVRNNPIWAGLPNPARDVSSQNLGWNTWVNAGYLCGSAHPSGIQACFADGSVHTITYGIKDETFNTLGHPSSQLPLNPSDF
jgi:hypothetical protein